VAVNDEVGEQQPALASGQARLKPLAVALDSKRPADLDAQGVSGRQGHANILAIRWVQSLLGGPMAKLIRCECGFVARGDSDDQVIGVIRGHLATDHPALVDTVSRQDLLGWIQVE